MCTTLKHEAIQIPLLSKEGCPKGGVVTTRCQPPRLSCGHPPLLKKEGNTFLPALRRSALIIVSFLLLTACTPDLERPNVPIISGIRLNHYPYSPGETPESRAAAERNVHQQNLQTLQEWGLTHLLIDVPLDYDSLTGGPKLDTLTLQALDRALSAYQDQGLTFHLALTPDHPGELFPHPEVALPADWFTQLGTCINEAETRMVQAGCIPVRTIIGSNLRPFEADPEGRQQLRAALQAGSGSPLAYAMDITRLDSLESFEGMDELALNYPPQPTDQHKPFCREWNTKASQVAAREGLPVFIFQSNVIGQELHYQLLNRLRFWKESVPLQGLTLNSLYSQVSLSDSSTYFALKGDPYLRESLQKYLAQ